MNIWKERARIYGVYPSFPQGQCYEIFRPLVFCTKTSVHGAYGTIDIAFKLKFSNNFEKLKSYAQTA
jgi:hypothetical protein